MGFAVDISNKIFGRLTVMAVTVIKEKTKWRTYCLCKCICGEYCSVLRDNLVAEKQVSCGCNKDEKNLERRTTHGLRHTTEYETWAAIWQRCTNSKRKDWKAYGGRGITVCNRWLKFENFFIDMGLKPNKELSIDRIDNEKGYFKENCRWATRSQQNKNRRKFKRKKII